MTRAFPMWMTCVGVTALGLLACGGSRATNDETALAPRTAASGDVLLARLPPGVWPETPSRELRALAEVARAALSDQLALPTDGASDSELRRWVGDAFGPWRGRRDDASHDLGDAASTLLGDTSPTERERALAAAIVALVQEDVAQTSESAHARLREAGNEVRAAALSVPSPLPDLIIVVSYYEVCASGANDPALARLAEHCAQRLEAVQPWLDAAEQAAEAHQGEGRVTSPPLSLEEMMHDAMDTEVDAPEP